MKLRQIISITAGLAMCCWGSASAQYYSWGDSPASIRWQKLKTPELKLIYPATFESNARRIKYYLDTVRPHIGYGLSRGTMPTPVVLHTQNMVGNGIVMWAPKRVELISAPGTTYSEPWLKGVALHEYRHNAQYNNLNTGTIRALSWLLGQQIKLLGHGMLGLFLLEGDAVMAETEASAFGRGLQPSFTMHYRAVGDVGSDRYSKDFWFGGSFKHFVPDHYRLGYQLTRWGYHRYGTGWLDPVMRYVGRNPQFLFPLSISLKKYYGTGEGALFRDAFAELNRLWASLPETSDSASKLPTPTTSYTTYQWPLWLDDSTLVAFKTDLDRPSRIVKVDVETGEESLVTHTGIVSSRPTFDGRRLWWTEFRSSTLWDERVASRLCWLDVATGRQGTVRTTEQLFYPTPTGSGELAAVVYDYSGQFSVRQGIETLRWQVDFPMGTEITGLAWDDATGGLWFTGLDDGGMWLGRIKSYGNGYERITPSRHITISELRAGGGKLWFGSIASGKDEAHCYDLATDKEYRVSSSQYGSFQPAPAASGERIALTTYDAGGYKLAVQSTATALEEPARELPTNLVNPDWRGWDDFPRMDSIVYTPERAERTNPTDRAEPTDRADQQPSRRYRKALNLLNLHSWLPLDFYPPAALDEMRFDANLGATVMSQSLLGDMTSWLGYGWNPAGGSSLKGGLTYTGLGPHISVGFTWGGGNQTLYTAVPQSLALKKYYSTNTSISLPLVLTSGYNYRVLTPLVEYFYTNGLILTPETFKTYRLTRGVERLNFGLTYSWQTRTAHRDFLPRWGLTVQGNYMMNPTNRSFRSLYLLYGRTYLPGLGPHHSTTLRGSWQQALGDKNTRPMMFQAKALFPRGARYDFATQSWASGSLDYQLPVWYPDSGIPSVLYFKRLRLNLFADYARWQDNLLSQWHTLYSYGGDLIVDFVPFKMPSAATMTAKITLARPSDRSGVVLMFGFSTPL
ncbi:MAG: hypothetical protein LBM63_01130 [Rikenellaceae bacterium]|jgi:hypothetical protein|nr:hypothetical protein [Rikenellaceae bacterium]